MSSYMKIFYPVGPFFCLKGYVNKNNNLSTGDFKSIVLMLWALQQILIIWSVNKNAISNHQLETVQDG